MDNDAPISCKTERRFQSDVRSSKPKLDYLYCGHIETEDYFFRVKESRSFSLMAQKRESIVENLKVGCRFVVDVVGPSSLGETPKNSIGTRISTITSIRKELGCD